MVELQPPRPRQKRKTPDQIAEEIAALLPYSQRTDAYIARQIVLILEREARLHD